MKARPPGQHGRAGRLPVRAPATVVRARGPERGTPLSRGDPAGTDAARGRVRTRSPLRGRPETTGPPRGHKSETGGRWALVSDGASEIGDMTSESNPFLPRSLTVRHRPRPTPSPAHGQPSAPSVGSAAYSF